MYRNDKAERSELETFGADRKGGSGGCGRLPERRVSYGQGGEEEQSADCWAPEALDHKGRPIDGVPTAARPSGKRTLRHGGLLHRGRWYVRSGDPRGD